MQAEASWLELNKVTNYYHVNSGRCMVMPAIQYLVPNVCFFFFFYIDVDIIYFI